MMVTVTGPRVIGCSLNKGSNRARLGQDLPKRTMQNLVFACRVSAKPLGQSGKRLVAPMTCWWD